MSTLHAVPEVKLDLLRDESALRDAIAALDYFDDPAELADLEEKIASLRRRLPDRGARVDAREGVQYVRGDRQPGDPPGSRRFRREGAPEPEEFPRGPLNGGAALSALAAVAVALAGMA